MAQLTTLALLLIYPAVLTSAFQCFTCNNRPQEDDTKPCAERVEECSPGVDSCSTVVFKTITQQMHIRKFCTSPGTPIYQYLLFFPGSSLCQNIETTNIPTGPQPPAPITRADRLFPQEVQPPSPPHQHLSNLLCVCTKSGCNGGTFKAVMERSMLQNIDSNINTDSNDIKNELFVENGFRRRAI